MLQNYITTRKSYRLVGGKGSRFTEVKLSKPVKALCWGYIAAVLLLSIGVPCVYLASQVRQLMDAYGLLVFPVPKYGRGLELLRLLHTAGMEGPFFGNAHFL